MRQYPSRYHGLASPLVISFFAYVRAVAGPEPISISVRPAEVLLGVDRELISVTLANQQGTALPGVAVDFVSADPGLAFFPFPRAYTDTEGNAFTVIESRIEENGFVPFETTFSVSVESTSAGPFPVRGEGFHFDGPYRFEGPPLGAFYGRSQRLIGTLVNVFEFLQVGDRVPVWSIDPTVAEISEGQVIETQNQFQPEAVVEFTVTAHREGVATFIIGTVDLTAYRSDVTGELDPPGFLRADCNGDGEVSGTVADAVTLLAYNFTGGAEPPCLVACDANGDGVVVGTVTDAVYVLNYNFLGSEPPPPPFPDCGPPQGPGDGSLGCESPAAACQ